HHHSRTGMAATRPQAVLPSRGQAAIAMVRRRTIRMANVSSHFSVRCALNRLLKLPKVTLTYQRRPLPLSVSRPEPPRLHKPERNGYSKASPSVRKREAT